MKVTFVLATCFFCCTAVKAQEFRLNGYAGYVFDDAINSYYNPTSYYDGKVKGGFRWGVGLEYLLHEYYGLELMYLRQDTKAPTYYWDDNREKFKDFDLGMNWIMLGGVRYLKKGKVEPYGGFLVGISIADLKDPDNGNSRSSTNFAWGLRGGANIFFNEKVGIKLQADLLSAVQSMGGGFYFGTGGAGVGATSYSTLYQFGLGGGLVFRFPKK